MSASKRTRRGFSLLELVIVVVIIGIIAAIAIPRLSRGATGAADATLAGDLAVMRNAIDLYSVEHNGAAPTAANVTNQLLIYSDANGLTSATKTGNFTYGPYLRKAPPLPLGARKGCTGFAAADAPGVGWIYTAATGSIAANCGATELDASGKKYSDY